MIKNANWDSLIPDFKAAYEGMETGFAAPAIKGDLGSDEGGRFKWAKVRRKDNKKVEQAKVYVSGPRAGDRIFGKFDTKTGAEAGDNYTEKATIVKRSNVLEMPPLKIESSSVRMTMTQLRNVISEAVQLDLEVGDVVLTGRFKNKRTVVKKIGKDDLGQPTVNGMKALSFRIEKLMPKSKWTKKSLDELENE